jgi:hypothetical protein
MALATTPYACAQVSARSGVHGMPEELLQGGQQASPNRCCSAQSPPSSNGDHGPVAEEGHHVVELVDVGDDSTQCGHQLVAAEPFLRKSRRATRESVSVIGVSDHCNWRSSRATRRSFGGLSAVSRDHISHMRHFINVERGSTWGFLRSRRRTNASTSGLRSWCPVLSICAFRCVPDG